MGLRSHPCSHASAPVPAALESAAVTICICTKGRPADLAETLASIERSTWPIAQVVVSDDGRDPSTEAVCREAPLDVDYVLGPQRGLGANRNRAIAASNGRLVLFLDDDCHLGRDFIERALAGMRSARERHAAERVIVSGRELNDGRLIRAHDQTFLGFQAKAYARDERLRSIVINATLFPADVFDHVKFDPQLVYGYEEVDFAVRAVAAGYIIVACEDAINDHRPSPHGRESYDRYVDASRLRVTLRRYLVAERAPVHALAFAIIAPVHLLAADVKRLGLRGVRRTAETLALAVAMLTRAG